MPNKGYLLRRMEEEENYSSSSLEKKTKKIILNIHGRDLLLKKIYSSSLNIKEKKTKNILFHYVKEEEIAFPFST